MRHYLARIRAVLALCLALGLALRVVAMPWVMAAPEPGVMAICAGGQIVYVSLDGTPVPDQTPQSDDCPLLGVTAAVLSTAPQVLPWVAEFSSVSLLPARTIHFVVSALSLPPVRGPPYFRLI